jgi:hypothetical protein
MPPRSDNYRLIIMRFVSLLFNRLAFDREVFLTSSIVIVKKVKLASSTNSEEVTLTSSIITICEECESSFCAKVWHAHFACTIWLLWSPNHVSRILRDPET